MSGLMASHKKSFSPTWSRQRLSAGYGGIRSATVVSCHEHVNTQHQTCVLAASGPHARMNYLSVGCSFIFSLQMWELDWYSYLSLSRKWVSTFPKRQLNPLNNSCTTRHLVPEIKKKCRFECQGETNKQTKNVVILFSSRLPSNMKLRPRWWDLRTDISPQGWHSHRNLTAETLQASQNKQIKIAQVVFSLTTPWAALGSLHWQQAGGPLHVCVCVAHITSSSAARTRGMCSGYSRPWDMRERHVRASCFISS